MQNHGFRSHVAADHMSLSSGESGAPFSKYATKRSMETWGESVKSPRWSRWFDEGLFQDIAWTPRTLRWRFCRSTQPNVLEESTSGDVPSLNF